MLLISAVNLLMIVFFKKMGNSVYDRASVHEITDNLTCHDIENIQVSCNK